MTTKPKAKPKPTKKSGPGHERMKAQLGPKKTEALRQAVVADQTRARSDVKTVVAGKPAKTSKPVKDEDARKIMVLATANPHKSGSRRAKWFAKLKTE